MLKLLACFTVFLDRQMPKMLGYEISTHTLASD